MLPPTGRQDGWPEKMPNTFTGYIGKCRGDDLEVGKLQGLPQNDRGWRGNEQIKGYAASLGTDCTHTGMGLAYVSISISESIGSYNIIKKGVEASGFGFQE